MCQSIFTHLNATTSVRGRSIIGRTTGARHENEALSSVPSKDPRPRPRDVEGPRTDNRIVAPHTPTGPGATPNAPTPLLRRRVFGSGSVDPPKEEEGERPNARREEK